MSRKTPRVNMSIDFGPRAGLKLTCHDNPGRDEPIWTADYHHLTGEQFDALVEAFDTARSGQPRTLTTDKGRTFRSATVLFGGVRLSIFTDDVQVSDEQTALEL